MRCIANFQCRCRCDCVFVPLDEVVELPKCFPSPFDNTPHPAARIAAEHLQSRLPELARRHDFPGDGGKMFGVLVVRRHSGQYGYLAGYSGMLAEKWCHDQFVPPIFDQPSREQILSSGERELEQFSDAIDSMSASRELRVLKRLLARAQRQAQNQLAALKHRNSERKRVRHEIRRSGDGSTEAMLALQSSDDRRELRALGKTLEDRVQRSRDAWLSARRRIEDLRQQRRELSRRLQSQLFEGYKLCAADGDRAVMNKLFSDGLPPGGAGDCAAAKLLHYANVRALELVCMAEFWWEPGGTQRGLRRHRCYYPACKSKCGPLMPFLLKGLVVAPAAQLLVPEFDPCEPGIIYEDDDIIAVSKPAGMLSVPGKSHSDSVEQRLAGRHGSTGQRMLIHRLDQATSGLLLAAKNRRAHKSLHKQFENRQISKRYVAVLDGVLARADGQIDMPLRVDLEDRPRQLVCYEHGRQASTGYEVVGRTDSTTRVHFYPFSGRTHQLRVHAAHPDGLGAPIVGDELYGKSATRLLLHAEYLRFRHPDGNMMELHDKPPF